MTPSDSPLDQFSRFRVLLDVIPQPAVVKDSQGRIALANQAAAKLWKRTPEELVGLTAGDLLDPASACWAEAVDTIMLHSSAPKLLQRTVRVPGQEKSFRVSVAPVYLSPAERVDGIIVVVDTKGDDTHDAIAGVLSQAQLAMLGLLKCELGEKRPEVKQQPFVRRMLDATEFVSRTWVPKPVPVRTR